MRKGVSEYVLKEYGSWSVLVVAFLTGLIVSRGFKWQAVPLFLSLGLLVNSKQALAKWIRKKTDRKSLSVFLVQIAAAAFVLLVLFNGDIHRLLLLLVFPAAYLLMYRTAGEHFALTEVLGFALISLAAVLAKFLVTNGVDVRLFIAVALYFSAGVFKIKALLRKRPSDRIFAALYGVFAIFGYRGFHIPLIILLPLIDNFLVAASLYRVKLRTTGWIEVAKSILFLVLMTFCY